MPKKLKLSLDALKVQSFVTSTEQNKEVVGGLSAAACITHYNTYCPDYTCGGAGTCYGATCGVTGIPCCNTGNPCR